jgi:hypothetical protein
VIIHLLCIQMELKISTTYIVYMFIITILSPSPTRSLAVDYGAWYKPVVHCVIGVDYAALHAVSCNDPTLIAQ